MSKRSMFNKRGKENNKNRKQKNISRKQEEVWTNLKCLIDGDGFMAWE